MSGLITGRQLGVIGRNQLAGHSQMIDASHHTILHAGNRSADDAVSQWEEPAHARCHAVYYPQFQYW